MALGSSVLLAEVLVLLFPPGPGIGLHFYICCKLEAPVQFGLVSKTQAEVNTDALFFQPQRSALLELKTVHQLRSWRKTYPALKMECLKRTGS